MQNVAKELIYTYVLDFGQKGRHHLNHIASGRVLLIVSNLAKSESCAHPLSLRRLAKGWGMLSWVSCTCMTMQTCTTLSSRAKNCTISHAGRDHCTWRARPRPWHQRRQWSEQGHARTSHTSIFGVRTNQSVHWNPLLVGEEVMCMNESVILNRGRKTSKYLFPCRALKNVTRLGLQRRGSFLFPQAARGNEYNYFMTTVSIETVSPKTVSSIHTWNANVMYF